MANSKQFKNSYITFEIPDRWNCIPEATEWVCRSTETTEHKEAIIVLTAKEAGPGDSLAIYENHMKNPIKATTNKGDTSLSQVMSPPKKNKINNLIWIDGFHLGSEIQNYYTRYIATIKERIAVLVTFSAHKEYYTKYSPDFFKAIDSLNVIATKNSLQPVPNGQSDSLMPIKSETIAPEVIGNLDLQEAQQQKKKNKLLYIIGAISFALVGLFLLFRLKKKK